MPNPVANRPVTLRVFAAVLALIPLLTSCGDDGGTDILPPPDPTPVAQVTVTGPATTDRGGPDASAYGLRPGRSR